MPQRDGVVLAALCRNAATGNADLAVAKAAMTAGFQVKNACESDLIRLNPTFQFGGALLSGSGITGLVST
jgi:hypothetical protein